jgi:hypothetical protein
LFRNIDRTKLLSARRIYLESLARDRRPGQESIFHLLKLFARK